MARRQWRAVNGSRREAIRREAIRRHAVARSAMGLARRSHRAAPVQHDACELAQFFFIMPSSFFIPSLDMASSFFIPSLAIESFFMPSWDIAPFFIASSFIILSSAAKAAGATATLKARAAAEIARTRRLSWVMVIAPSETGWTATDAPLFDVDVMKKAVVTGANENFRPIKFDANSPRSGRKTQFCPASAR